MPFISRRFRRPKAQLEIKLEEATPPSETSGGVVRLQVTLLPLEAFRVRGGSLELALLTTRFAPTALDGYHEYTSERIYHTATLGQTIHAVADEMLRYPVTLRLPGVPPPDSRPARRQWQARARFEIDGYRGLWAARVLRDVSPLKGGAPTVDGSGFLPLYEFGGNGSHSRQSPSH